MWDEGYDNHSPLGGLSLTCEKMTEARRCVKRRLPNSRQSDSRVTHLCTRSLLLLCGYDWGAVVVRVMKAQARFLLSEAHGAEAAAARAGRVVAIDLVCAARGVLAWVI